MHDHFFSAQTCDRCGGSLAGGKIMSMLNTETICLECKQRETERSDYAVAVEAERQALKSGNLNFPGIQGGKR